MQQFEEKIKDFEQKKLISSVANLCRKVKECY